MLKFLWKNFAIVYPLPFLMATMRTSQIEALGVVLRWVILAGGTGAAIAIGLGFKTFGGRRLKLALVDQIIIWFLGLFFISQAWSIQPNYTIQRAISLMLLYATSFWALWKYADCFSEEVLIDKILKTIGLVLALNLVLGFFVFPGGMLAGRFRGLFINPNNIGIIMGLGLPLAVVHWLRNRQRVHLIITIIFAMNLLASGSRSAMLGVAVAIVAIFTSLTAQRPRQAIFVALVGIIGIVAFSQTDFFVEQVVREGSLATGSNRTYFWELARGYIANRPDFGHGFGTDVLIHQYYDVSLSDLRLRGAAVMSSYYGLAVQMGWPMTIAFFGLLWSFIIYNLVRHWRDYVLVGFVATLASGLIISIFEPVIYSAGNAFSFLFWMIFMLVVRRLRYQKREILYI